MIRPVLDEFTAGAKSRDQIEDFEDFTDYQFVCLIFYIVEGGF